MSSQLRLAALQLALGSATATATGSESPDAVVSRATAYFNFLNTASPDAIAADTAPATKAPRVIKDKVAPAVVEEETVTERPTLTAGPTSAEAASAPEASAEEQSSATADAGSAETPLAEAVQPADGASDTPPDVTVVNAAVMKAVGKIGKEATVAILKSFGGAKVPEVPVDQHAALLAALTAAVA